MKRIISFLIVLSIILCLPCINVSAAQSTYGDEAIIHLQNLGVLGNDVISADYITRAEFAQAICNITGNREPMAGTYSFYDLAVDHPCYDAVQHCVQRGYLNGSGGMFRPDDYITYIEAMTVMARVLNYTEYAKNKGDYTLGYYTTAKMLGLLNGTDITSSDEPMTYQNAAAMIYNALKCNINRLSEISPIYHTYATIDKTLAYEMLSLNYVKGVMTSNGYTDISGNGNYGDKLVVVGGKKLSSRNLDVSHRNLIGQEVSVYYDDNNNVVSIAPTSKNTILTIKRSEFTDFSDLTLKYLENDVERKVKISSKAPYFLNGVPVIGFNSTGIDGAAYADIHLIDNNDDLEYDAVFVNVYKTFVVYSVDSNGVVSSYNDESFVDLGEENGKETVIYDASGKVISADDIIPYSVISVMETEDFIYAVNIEGYLTGKVSQIDDYSVIVNDLECDVPNGTANYFDGVKVGSYINIFIDFEGRVVFVEENTVLSNNQEFGFVVNCKLETGIGKELKIKLFTKHGEMKVFKVRNKFKINDVSYTVSKLTSLPAEFLTNGEIKNTVILYEVNKDNEITDITFAVTELGEDEDGFMQTYSKYRNTLTSSGYYYAKIFVNAGTVFFNVPADLDDEDAYKVKSFSKMLKTTQTVDAFHLSKNNGYADIVVVYGKHSNMTYDTTLSVITKIAKGIDEDGTEVLKVTHFRNNVPTVSVVKDEAIITKIKTYKPGDAVRFVLVDDEITLCERVYDYENGIFTKSSIAGSYATHSLYQCEGYVAYDNNKFFRVNNTDKKVATGEILHLDGFLYGSAKVMIVEDSERGVNVTTGTKNDVKLGSHIVLQARAGRLAYIVVYRDI